MKCTLPNRAYFAGFDFSNHAVRAYLLEALCQWVIDFDIDGFRFDDSDLTPFDFLQAIRVTAQVEKRSVIKGEMTVGGKWVDIRRGDFHVNERLTSA